jgi:hypothetical protein
MAISNSSFTRILCLLNSNLRLFSYLAFEQQ